MLKEGDILKDRYKISQLIGRGGMSSVYMGLDMKLTNKLWAIKEVSKKATDQAGRPIEQSLAMEAELLSKLDHPTIVDIVDIIATDDYIYVVMDYVEGKSLDKVVREEGPQSEEDVQDWSLQICDALDYLHNQDPPIIYRDMKPSNIMLRPDGYIKLIDLGVAREYKDQSKKDTISFGTEGYAPPEQYGKAQTDARSDIYALGATMWHLLSGESPSEYPLPDVRKSNETVGEGFAKVIIPKCTMLDRELRYQNCDELMSDLEVYEELTQEYFDEQKKKVLTFARCAAAGLAMLLLSLILFITGNIIVTQNYQSQLGKAESTENISTEEKEAAYNEAIKYKPGELDPYIGLLNLYQTTGNGDPKNPVITSEEVNKIKNIAENNEIALKDSGNYSKLYYELGKAIWDNYDDGSNNSEVLIRDTANMRALPFFKLAQQNTNDEELKTNCSRYIDIAEFADKIRKNHEDNEGSTSGDDQKLIKNYFDSLVALCNVADKTPSYKVRLNAYAMIRLSLYNYSNDFAKANIDKSEVVKLYDRINTGLNQISFDPGKYNTAKQECLGSMPSTSSHIEMAYNNVAGK